MCCKAWTIWSQTILYPPMLLSQCWSQFYFSKENKKKRFRHKSHNGMRQIAYFINLNFRHRWKWLDEIEIVVVRVRAQITASNLLVGIIIGLINEIISPKSTRNAFRRIYIYICVDVHSNVIENPKQPKFDVASVNTLTHICASMLPVSSLCMLFPICGITSDIICIAKA